MSWLRRQICRLRGHRWTTFRDPWWGTTRRCGRCARAETLERGLIPQWWIDTLIAQLRENNVMVQLMGQR